MRLNPATLRVATWPDESHSSRKSTLAGSRKPVLRQLSVSAQYPPSTRKSPLPQTSDPQSPLSKLENQLGDGVPTTTHKYVLDVLRNSILRGDLEGGTRLIQADIASSLGVSTTPVREALRDLVAEGLILFDAHRGAVVHELSTDELREIYLIRDTLEPLAAAHVKVTPELVEELQQLNDRMRETPDMQLWMELNRAFHMKIYESTGLSRLANTIGELHDASMRYILASLRIDPKVRHDGDDDHERILAALQRGDVEQAKSATKEHVAMSTALIEYLGEIS